jgi:type I restriction enzyme S subunit
MIVLRPAVATVPSFMGYAADCHASNVQKASMGRGTTVKHIYPDELKQLALCFPPVDEQNAIAAFLDRETAKIDALVAEQERLIGLLREKRQAVISHAVTRGLTPKVPMKDSGVAWLGEIPAHWRLERGRFLFRKLELPPEPDDGVVTAFRDGQVTLRENRRTEGFTVAVLEVGYQHVRKGDLVVHGMDAFAGAIGVSESSGKCTPEYAVLTPLKDDVNGYFALVLRLMAQRDFIFVICPSVRERAPRFRFEALKDVVLPVPPVEEQRQILSLIESQGQGVDSLLAEAQRAIDLLQDRRTALISAAVTGQIDVRKTSGKAA